MTYRQLAHDEFWITGSMPECLNRDCLVLYKGEPSRLGAVCVRVVAQDGCSAWYGPAKPPDGFYTREKTE